MDELNRILARFIESGWELIKNPSEGYLEGRESLENLMKAVKQADVECGSCGCELDPLYKRCLVLLEERM